MSATPIAVTGASVLTAAGGLDQTAAAIRAGLCRFDEHTYYESVGPDPEWDPGEPLIAARVPSIDPFASGPERLHALLGAVLADLAGKAALKRADVNAGALLIALPGADASVEGWDLAGSFLAESARRTGLSFKHARVSLGGHAGMLELCAEASAMLARGEAETCVVAGVDSYLSADRMARMDLGYRLKSPRNVDGFIPGEAAAALLIEAPGKPRGRAAIGTIAAIGIGREKETSSGDKPSSGAGLTEALRAALPGGPAGAWVLCDLNGESYRSFEWGIALARLGERLGPVKKLVFPASTVGDVGAASGGLFVAAALTAFQRGYAPDREALIWTSSDGPLRAAARIARVEG